MQINPPRPINLLQLKDELATAGIAVNALGSTGDPPSEVHTYDPDGLIVDLPAAAAPVIAAHVPQPDPAVVQRLGALATALNNGTAYLDPAVVPSPTQAQLDAAKVQRNAWATLLGVQPLSIPVTQPATAADIVPLGG